LTLPANRYSARVKTNRRQLRLTFPATGESVLAELLDDEAPRRLRAHLGTRCPSKAKAFTACIPALRFVMMENPKPSPSENLCQLSLPGELFISTTRALAPSARRNRSVNWVIVYGRGVTLRAHEACPRIALCSRASP